MNYLTSMQRVFIRFLEESSARKFFFEIIWPLDWIDVPFNRKVDPKRALIWINHNPTSLRTLWSSMLASRTSINYRVVRGSRERSTSRKQLTTNKKKFFRSELKIWEHTMKKIVGVVWELPAKYHSQSSPFPLKLGWIGCAF